MNGLRKRLLFAFITHLLLLCPGWVLSQAKQWTLDECIQRALRENVALNQGIANNEVNKVNYDQARAGRYPNLNLTDAHNLNYGRSIDPATSRYVSQNVSANNLGLTSSITLFNGMKYVNLVKENRLSLEAGRLDIAKMQNDLTLAVLAAYTQMLYEYEAVNIADAVIKADSEHVKYTAKYVKAGSMPESTLLQVLAQTTADKAAKVNAENQLELARVALMQLMEMPISDDFEIERPSPDQVMPTLSGTPGEVYRIAEGILPEVKSAETKTHAAEIALRVSRAELMPKLSLTGSLATSYSSFNSLVTYSSSTQQQKIGYLQDNPSSIVYGPVTTTTQTTARYPFLRQFGDNFGQGISLNLTVPIFNNYLYKSDIRRSEIAIRVAMLNEQAIKNQLRKSIEQAYADELAASRNYIASKEQLVSEERSYHDVEVKFRAGTANATELFVEKSNYDKALYSNLSARYDFMYKSKIVAFYTAGAITK